MAHGAVLEATGAVDAGDSVDPQPEVALRVAPAGGVARVVESSVGRASVVTDGGVVPLVVVGRSEEVEGLPPPVDGVLYLVSRLTALAARDRSDLVFPHFERRDEGGVVRAAGALGQFDRGRHRTLGWPGRSRTWFSRLTPIGLRRWWADLTVVTRWTGVVFAVATGLVGAVFGALPSFVGADAGFLWVTGLLALLSVLALWGGARMWRHRQDVMTRRGTAYVIDEVAGAWTYEEKARFVDALSSHFAAVLHVPGPSDLGARWNWPLREGADRWGDELDNLVRSFWAVHFNDNHVTHNAVLIWAWWPVAMGFGARATSGRRGLTLRVRQRPSWGREGWIGADGWANEAHVFVRNPALKFEDRQQEARPLELTIRNCRTAATVTAPGAGTVGAPSEPAKVDHEELGPGPVVTVLLVRMTGGMFGAKPEPGGPEPAPPKYSVDDYAGLGICGLARGRLLEWSDVVAPGHHPWDRYPELAQAAFEWIRDQAADAPGPVLLGMLVPQEVAVGMGVLVGAAPKAGWPESILPLHYDSEGDRFVVPGLDLGAAALGPQRL